MFRGNLGKQESALLFVGDEESMPSDLNLIRVDGPDWREKRNFNFEFLEFFLEERRKPRVAKRSAGGAPHNALPKWLLAFDHTDATAQTPANMQSYKNAVPLPENSIFGYAGRELRLGDGQYNRLARPFQKRSDLFFRGALHPETSCGSQAY